MVVLVVMEIVLDFVVFLDFHKMQLFLPSTKHYHLNYQKQLNSGGTQVPPTPFPSSFVDVYLLGPYLSHVPYILTVAYTVERHVLELTALIVHVVCRCRVKLEFDV